MSWLPQGAVGDRVTRVLLFLMEWDRPWGPSVRECCEAVGVRSTSTLHTHLLRLRREGLVTWEAGRGRTLQATVTQVRRAS